MAPRGWPAADLHLNPYLFAVGPVAVRWYGFFMALSMAVGIRFLVLHARARGVDEEDVYNFALVAIVAGAVGARLVYVVTNWSAFGQDPGAILRVYQGGLSIHGAMVGALAFGLWYAARRRLPFWVLADGMVPGACVGIFLVRIGNIFNGEILGRHAAILGGARHPAQAYEMAFALILWVLYWRQIARGVPDGVAFWNFLLGYGILRFVSEAFRDNPLYLIHYVNPELGIGLTTLTQLFTPLILGVAWAGRRWRYRVGIRHPVAAVRAPAPEGGVGP